MGANVIVEFENVFLIGGIFLIIGKKILIRVFFLKIGGNGANVLVEFEKKILSRGIFF